MPSKAPGTAWNHIDSEFFWHYPFNLILDICHEDVSQALRVCPGRLDEVLDMLSDRDQQVLAMRYEHNMTMPAIAKELGITRQRVRQIIVKALQRLRHPKRLDILLSVPRRDYLEQANQCRQLQQKLDRLEAHMDELQDMAENGCRDPKRFIDVLNIPIGRLDMSARLYKCLTLRANVKTVGDIMKYNRRELMALRNFGIGCMVELDEKLSELDLVLNP